MGILALSDFANLLDYFSVEMDIEYFQEDSGRTGNGEDIVTDTGDPRWYGKISLDQRMTHAKAMQAQALVALLDGAIGRFYMYDPRLPYPQADPDGTILGAANPTIYAISADRTQIRITDLPGGYTLTLGDRFHSNYGSDPAHRAYHWICATISAAGGGTTGLFTVKPHVPVGVNVGDAIQLKKPSPLWRLVSNTKQAGTGQGQITPGPSWRMVQVP